MPCFKKLALIATEIQGKTSAETAETATEPKTIPPAVFKNGREVKIKNHRCRKLSYRQDIFRSLYICSFSVCMAEEENAERGWGGGICMLT